jgi:5-methyltetrahydrofolate--homocysteine methyltransferase
MSIIDKIRANVIQGHSDLQSKYPPELAGAPGVKELVQSALDEGMDVSVILKEGLIAGMDIVGERFSNGEIFVPEMLISAQSMKAGMKVMEHLLVGTKSESLGTVILGTVKGDMHDIGKNLVGMILEGGGFKVVDLGVNAGPDKFIDKAKEYPDAVIGLSALLTTTIVNMKTTIQELRNAGMKTKVIIGGAAVSQKFAEEIQADGFSRDAAKAVPLVKGLLGIV